MLSNRPEDTLFKIPNSAINFYTTGFVSIYTSIFNDNVNQESDARQQKSVNREKNKIDWGKVILEIFWSIMFWSSLWGFVYGFKSLLNLVRSVTW